MTKLLEDLWDGVKKTPDGKSVMFTDQDVEFLWHCGFVDTQQVPFSQWAAFFAPFFNKDAKVYLLGRANFMLIEDFRYKGPIREPFDFRKINEGYYTDQGLDELFELGIGPSVDVPRKEFDAFITDIKKTFRDKNKLIRVDEPCKKKIGDFMAAHPSPLRRLELIMEAKEAGVSISPDSFKYEVSGVNAVTAMQSSAFSMRPSSVAVSRKEALGKVTQAKAKPTDKTSDDATPLHKIRRSPRGTRG